MTNFYRPCRKKRNDLREERRRERKFIHDSAYRDREKKETVALNSSILLNIYRAEVLYIGRTYTHPSLING